MLDAEWNLEIIHFGPLVVRWENWGRERKWCEVEAYCGLHIEEDIAVGSSHPFQANIGNSFAFAH